MAAGGDLVKDRTKAVDNTAHYARMRDAGHLEFVKKARRCESFVEGIQWDEDVRAKLAAEGRPALTINKIFPSTMSMMGEQLQNMVDISFRPTSSGNEETAKALDIAWLHTANANMLDWIRSEVFDSGAISGRGFYDLRISFNDNMRGDLDITRVSNRNAVLDPDANSYDPDDWDECAITKWMRPEQVAMLYDTAKAKELHARAQSDLGDSFGYDYADYPRARFGRGANYGPFIVEQERKKLLRVIERQHKEPAWKEHFVDRVTGETRVIPSTWDRDRIVQVLTNIPDLSVFRLQTFVIRWTVSALDLLLFDAESPYKHFTLVPYFPLLLPSGATVGLVENQLDPQQLINKATSQELHIVNTTANSGWKLKEGSLKNMDIHELEEVGAKTGLVLELQDVKDAEKINPNPVPTGIDRISQQARQDQFETSLVNKSQLGIDREDVSGKAIERKQLRGPVNLGKALANLVRSEHILARNAVDLIQAFWTEERMLRVTRKERGRDVTTEIVVNQMTPEGNVINDVTLGEYQVITSTVSLREQHEDTEFDQALALRQQGVDIADEELITLSRLRNKKEILERMQATAQARSQDLDVEREMKAAELEKLQTETQATKVEATRELARTKKVGEETNALMLEKQIELVKLTTALKQAENDTERLALERKKIDAEIAHMRRTALVEKAKARKEG